MNVWSLLAVFAYFAILTGAGPLLAAPTEMKAAVANVKDPGGAGQLQEGGRTYSPYPCRAYALAGQLEQAAPWFDRVPAL